MRKNKWSNVPGAVIIEVYRSPDLLPGPIVVEDASGKLLPEALAPFFGADDATDLVINFRSSGHYDEGYTSGLPENCYPPEENDEREVEYVEIAGGRRLTAELAEKIGQIYQNQIYDAEVFDNWYEED